MYAPMTHTSRKAQTAGGLTRNGHKKHAHRLSLRLEYLEQRMLLSEVPQLVKDINISPPGYPPLSDAVVINGIAYFAADDSVHGTELWRSDGTTAGTYVVEDINPGSSGSYPSSLADIDGTLYFSAVDGVHGPEEWRSDGTLTARTWSRTSTNRTAAPHMRTSDFTYVNGTLFFTSQSQLWKSNGTDAGTVLVADVGASDLTDVNGTLFFTASNAATGEAMEQRPEPP